MSHNDLTFFTNEPNRDLYSRFSKILKSNTQFFDVPDNNYNILYLQSNANLVIDNYPNIKRHLDRFKDIITSDNKPYGLHRARDVEFFEGERIIATRKCSMPVFSYVNFDSYFSHTFNLIKTKKINLLFLNGLLNSKLITFMVKI